MLLQAGPIAPSSPGLWAVTFVLGGLVAVVVWLVRRHFTVALPAHKRIFGDDADDTQDGHLKSSADRFDSIENTQADLAEEVDSLHDDVRKVDRRTELVLSNQAAIASELDVDLERPRFYREGRGDIDPDDSSYDVTDD